MKQGIYRIIPNGDTSLNFPDDFLLYDIANDTSRQILGMQSVTENSTGRECEAVIVDDPDRGAWMLVMPYDDWSLVMGCEIYEVLYEGEAHQEKPETKALGLFGKIKNTIKSLGRAS